MAVSSGEGFRARGTGIRRDDLAAQAGPKSGRQASKSNWEVPTVNPDGCNHSEIIEKEKKNFSPPTRCVVRVADDSEV